MDNTNSFVSITTAEAEEKKKYEELVKISKQIIDIRNQVNDRDLQYVKYQRELHDLKGRYYKLLVDKNIQERKIEMLKGKLDGVTKVYEKEQRVLEEQRFMVWREMEGFVTKTISYIGQAERKARVNQIVMTEEKNANAKRRQENADKRKRVLRMKGELEGMEVFKQWQAKRINELSMLLSNMKPICQYGRRHYF